MNQFILNSDWNESMLREVISSEMATYIITDIKPKLIEEIDRPYWMAAIDGAFLVKSAFELPRKKNKDVQWAKKTWLKGIPHKMSFSCGESSRGESQLMMF